jgi:hypothetical protein
LQISPDEIDFLSTMVSCSTLPRTVSVTNICSAQILINGASILGNGFIISTPLVTGPLNARQTSVMQVKYQSTASGRTTGTLKVDYVPGATISSANALLLGESTTNTRVQETHQVPTKADVLLVVDDSGSMTDKQTSLSNNMGLLFTYANQANVDFNVGITTTDMASGLRQGRLVGTPAVITRNTPGALSVLAARAVVGTSGSGVEGCLDPATNAVTAPLSTGTNAGFVRNDAALGLIFVTDAQDQSPFNYTYYLQRLVNTKGARKQNQMSISGMLPLSPTGVPNCAYDNTPPIPILSHTESVRLTGGSKAEICDYANAPANYAEIGATSFGRRRTWLLGSTPDTVNPNLSVTFNGAPLPAMAGATTNWVYDVVLKAVVLSPTFALVPNDTLTFSYNVACLP